MTVQGISELYDFNLQEQENLPQAPQGMDSRQAILQIVLTALREPELRQNYVESIMFAAFDLDQTDPLCEKVQQKACAILELPSDENLQSLCDLLQANQPVVRFLDLESSFSAQHLSSSSVSSQPVPKLPIDVAEDIANLRMQMTSLLKETKNDPAEALTKLVMAVHLLKQLDPYILQYPKDYLLCEGKVTLQQVIDEMAYTYVEIEEFCR
jgi:hypothetical protein